MDGLAVRRPVVLIVEDELLLRIRAVEWSLNAGFQVVEPATPTRQSPRSPPRDIHIVFTDLQMPDSMDGLKLARFVRDRWPQRTRDLSRCPVLPEGLVKPCLGPLNPRTGRRPAD